MTRLPDLRGVLDVRRVAAAGLLVLAAVLAVQGAGRSDQADAGGVAVLRAAADLPAGTTLRGAAVEVEELAEHLVPDGALGPEDLPVAGRDEQDDGAASPVAIGGPRLVGAVRAGEVLTDARLVGPGLLAGDPRGEVRAVAVRVADAAEVALVVPGDRVDVLAARADLDGGGALARVVGAALPVLDVPPPADGGGPADGAVVVVAAAPETAARLAGAAVADRLGLAVLP